MYNSSAVERAKANIEQNFATVVIVEHIELSLLVLESSLPSYFRGVVAEYKKGGAGGVRTRSNTAVHQPLDTLTPAESSFVRALLGLEYELYTFAVSFLARRAKACGFSTTSLNYTPPVAPARISSPLSSFHPFFVNMHESYSSLTDESRVGMSWTPKQEFGPRLRRQSQR